MPKICYQEHSFSKSSLGVVTAANDIVEEYFEQGYTLTLRQLYYQFVARDWLPNSDRSYKRLGSIITTARRAGMIDWTALEDRTRNLQSRPHWEDPRDFLETTAGQFHVDLWRDQSARVEVWVEKDALAGVVEKACYPIDVPYFSCRGYTSDSEMWAAAQRMAGMNCDEVHVLHLGDHDPSGIDMSRDIGERLARYSMNIPSHRRTPIYVHRIALNMDQVDEYSPPPNPAKLTDSRCRGYIENYGRSSWELDALEPRVLVELISKHVSDLMDESQFTARVELRDDGRDKLYRSASKMDQSRD